MIIAQLNGGLGNQMFQYANGRACAMRLGTGLRLDISEFKVRLHHQGYELSNIFNGPFEVASAGDVRKLVGYFSSQRLHRLVSKIPFFLRKHSYVQEPFFEYWDGIKGVKNNSYLSGYWQSEKYFDQFRAQIIKDFSFKDSLEGLNASIAAQISSDGIVPISLHVRRGDYVSSSKTQAYHGTCSLDYYQRAIYYFSDKFKNVHFFVFSDDPVWVKKNLQIHFPHTFVSHNAGNASFKDMRLMSLCNHHILANSSFSWWGAWLNQSPNKIVIAPIHWFLADINTKDLLPSSWIRL